MTSTRKEQEQANGVVASAAPVSADTNSNDTSDAAADDVSTTKSPTEENQELSNAEQENPQFQPNHKSVTNRSEHNQQRQSGGITPVLRNALFSLKDRMFVLSLEQELISFVSSNTDSYMLRPMNSYYRLLTHQTAEYYHLGHSLNNDGRSILLFKEVGADLTLPPLLASMPYDVPQPLQNLHPQFHAAHATQFQQHQQFFPPPGFGPPGGSPNAPGASPFGFVSPQQFGFPIQQQGLPPFPQHHQPAVPFNQLTPPSATGGSFSGPKINYSASPIDVTKKDPSVPATPLSANASQTQFKLMKRNTDDSKKDSEATTPTEAKEESQLPEDAATTEDPVKLESERASRETLYQRARERIFQAEEDEEEDEDENDADEKQKTKISSTSPDIPRVIPQQFPPQFQYPQVPLLGIPPQPYYYPVNYPQGGIPPQNIAQFPIGNESIPSPQGFIPNHYYYNQGIPQQQQQPHHQQQPYRKHRNYNNNGYRKNYNNYNNNNSNNYNSYNNQGHYSNGSSYGNERGQKDRTTEELSNELNGKLRIDEATKNENQN